MLLSVIYMFGREISPLQCAKRTAGYCFAFFVKLHDNRSTHFVWHFFLQKSDLFFSTFRHSHKQTTTNTCMKLCVNFLFSTLLLEKKSFSPFTLILSVQTHSVCGVGKCHLLRVDHKVSDCGLWGKCHLLRVDHKVSDYGYTYVSMYMLMYVYFCVCEPFGVCISFSLGLCLMHKDQS